MNDINEIKKSELQYDEKTRKLSVNPAVAGAAGLSTVALISQPLLAAPSNPVTDITTGVNGLSGLATAAAGVAAIPVIIYFGWRIVKRVLAGGT